MKFASLVVVPILLTAAAGAARAGGYVSAGLGGSPDLGGDLTMLSAEDASSGRIAVGQSFGPLALEAGLGGFGVDGGTMVSASVSLKAKTNLVSRLDGYLRGGLERSWLRSDGAMGDLSGDGTMLGAGLEVGLPLVLADAAIWLEVDRQWMDLGPADGTADTLLLGMRIGL
jgi:hypothetical protein